MSIVVPRAERADWLREWRGELWHRARGPHGAGWSLLIVAAGSIPHALSLRIHSWRLLLEGRELRQAIRSLRRSPGFTFVCVATLAVGIGATTTIYTVVDGVLLAPLPYPGGDRLFRVGTSVEALDVSGLPATHALYLSLRERVRAADALGAYEGETAVLTDGADPLEIGVARISEGFLAMLGVRVSMGRPFADREHVAGANRVALISHKLWLARYGADPGIVGRTLRVNDDPFEVIGVLPDRFALLPKVDVWTPLVYSPDYTRAAFGETMVLGRRRQGVDFAGLQTDLSAAFERVRTEHPSAMRPFGVAASDYRDSLISGGVRRNLLLLLGAVAAVLLIACVNVANLFMARGETREHELAVRASLGAGRARLARQLLTEGMAIAFAGGITGLLISYLSVGTVLALLPTAIPRRAEIGVDWRVAVAALITTAGTGLLFALWPALIASGRPPAICLAETRTVAGSRKARRAGNVLLVLEVAQAMVLLVTGGLLVNTLLRMQRADAGFNLGDLFAVHLRLPSHSYAADGAGLEFGRRVLERLRTLPGVERVGLASATPFTGETAVLGLEAGGGIRGDGDTGLSFVSPRLEESAWASFVAFEPGYLSALGLDLRHGRGPTPADASPSAAWVWVNEAFAQAFFGETNAVGRSVRHAGRDDGSWLTIAGVFADLAHPALPASDKAELYAPYGSRADTRLRSATVNYVVRSHAVGAELVPLIRAAIWGVDPDLPIPTVARANELVENGLAPARFYATLLGFFAGVGLLLAAVGIFGVASYTTARRAKELGIRMAIGATAGDIMASILRQGVVGLGLATGTVAALASSRLLDQLLYDIQPADAATYVGVAAMLGAAGLLALWVPARRAAATDPLKSLRDG